MDKALNFPPLARSQGTATAEPTGVRPGMAETDPTQELDLELVRRVQRGDSAAFDLLVTDLSMPGQSGVDLALAVRGVRPDLPVIIVTGYGPTAEQLLTKAQGKFPVLPKPFAVAELVKLVQAELAKAACGPEI